MFHTTGHTHREKRGTFGYSRESVWGRTPHWDTHLTPITTPLDKLSNRAHVSSPTHNGSSNENEVVVQQSLRHI